MNLLDTGIVLDMIRRRHLEPGFISPIVLLETLRGIEADKRSTVREKLERIFTVLNINGEIIDTYCEVYRKLKQDGALLPDADLIIAATAIAHNLKLETNDEHFKRLKTLGLALI